jgi:hypothetical protein
VIYDSRSTLPNPPKLVQNLRTWSDCERAGEETPSARYRRTHWGPFVHVFPSAVGLPVALRLAGRHVPSTPAGSHSSPESAAPQPALSRLNYNAPVSRAYVVAAAAAALGGAGSVALAFNPWTHEQLSRGWFGWHPIAWMIATVILAEVFLLTARALLKGSAPAVRAGIVTSAAGWVLTLTHNGFDPALGLAAVLLVTGIAWPKLSQQA